MGDILSVSNAQELREALVDARGGEMIELAAGNYGSLNFKIQSVDRMKAVFDTPVTLTSADPNNPAIITAFDMRGGKNLTFDNLVFESTYTGEHPWTAPFKVTSGSEGITIRNSLFKGRLAEGNDNPELDGYANAVGLRVGSSTNIVIENNEFDTWYRGLTVGGSDDVQVVGNNVHSISADGMNFVSVNNVLIEDNYIHDFARAGDGVHSDMIQFWTRTTSSPSTDIIIRGNTLDVGGGDRTQGIFMRNEEVDQGNAGEEMFYQNVLIEENVILNKHLHGITVGETNGLIIRKNTVLDADETNTESSLTPKINSKSASTNVMIENNVSANNWSSPGHVTVQNQDPAAPGYYATEFIASSMIGEANGYVVDPNGEIAALDAGASRLRLNTAPDSLQPAFNITDVPDEPNSIIFDAGHTYGAAGNVTESDAQFIWDFGDGTGATGKLVRHTYTDAGRYDATLTVMTPDGAIATAASEIAIVGADMLSFDPQTGCFQAKGYGEATDIGNSDRASVATDDGYGIDLGGKGIATGVSKSQIARLFGAESFDMSMTLRADTLGSTGEVARVHANFDLSIVNRGEVAVRLETDSGIIRLTTTRATVNDGNDHDIRIVLDSEASRLEIHVDGALAAATDVEGAVRADFPRSLHFGHAWGKQNFDGTLTAFDLAVGSQDYPDYVGDVASIPDGVVPVEELPSILPRTENPVQDAVPDGHEAQDDSNPSADAAPPEDSPEAPVDESQDAPVTPDDSEARAPTVIIDAEKDRLEVVVDDNATSDVSDPDPVVVSPVGYERGGSISTAWTRHYDSEISAPEESEVFVDDAPVLTL